MTETAYHDERFGKAAGITPGRFRARDDAVGGTGFFIGVELPCEPAQQFHFNQYSSIREARP
jgi:hypothetical protein